MRLEAIIIGEAKKPLQYVKEAQTVKGRGIVGDRYYQGTGSFNRPPLDQKVREITFIDYDTLEKVNQRLSSKLDFLDLRRNLVIKNFDITLIGEKNFTIGSSTFKIQRYAPPCRYLSRILDEDMMRGLKYLGGYRAKIITSGKIKLADILKLA